MTDEVLTEAELSEKPKLPRSVVASLRKTEEWEHLRFGRHVRYSEEQVQKIIRSHVVRDWRTMYGALPGQTRRSAMHNTAPGVPYPTDAQIEALMRTTGQTRGSALHTLKTERTAREPST